MSQGSKTLWRVALKLVADGSLLMPGITTQDIVVDREDSTALTTGHAFYVLDAYAKDGTKVFPLNDGLTAPGFFDAQASVGYYRVLTAGPPAFWETFLRFTNLNGAPVTVFYKCYRWLGLD